MDYATRGIWLKDPGEMPFLRSVALKLARVVVLTVRGFYRHRLMVQAAALTYYTVLSIVPVLAVSFAVARGLGAYDDLKERAIVPFLDRFLGTTVEGQAVGPAAEGTGVGSSDLRMAVDQILAFVDKTDDLPLGLVGTFLFLYAAVKLLAAAESSVNDIWGIHRGRTWTRRFTDYIAFVVVTPILLLVGTAGMGWLRALDKLPKVGELDVGSFMAFLLQGAPFLVFWVALTFAYMALPNTRVRLRSAMIGGGVAAALWLCSQYLYIELQVGIAKYNALYASFAAFPIMLFWIFLSWAIFLIGAELSYSHQSVPLYTSIARMGVIDQAFRESLGLRVAGRIADAFLDGRPPRGSSELAAELGVSQRAVNQVLEALIERDLLAQTLEGEEDLYLPARDPETITVADVLRALRTETGAQPVPARTRLDERVDRIIEGLDREARASLHNYSLRELALAARAPEGEVPSAGEVPSTGELREAPEAPGS
jgi:membrane protein